MNLITDRITEWKNRVFPRHSHLADIMDAELSDEDPPDHVKLLNLINEGIKELRLNNAYFDAEDGVIVMTPEDFELLAERYGAYPADPNATPHDLRDSRVH